MRKPKPDFNTFTVGESLIVPAVWHKPRSAKGEAEPILIDVTKGTRIFDSQAVMLHKRTLSRSALNLYDLIAYKLKYNYEFVTLEPTATLEALGGISLKTFSNIRKELDFLIMPRRSRKNTYWVNPSVMFNGNRVKVFKNNVVVGGPADVDDLDAFLKTGDEDE